MASVSNNYAEVFVDGGGGSAAGSTQFSERVVYSQVQTGAIRRVEEDESDEEESLESRSASSMAQQSVATSAALQQQQPQEIHVSAAKSSSSSHQGQHIQLQQSHFSQDASSETQLADRIVGYGYQSFAIEDESAGTQQSGGGGVSKKESKFGQFRRSFGKGKKKRLPTGQASNFANSRDIIMKGWLHKQDSGGFHLWKRRWFVLRANELYYYKSPKDNGALGKVVLSGQQRIVPTDDNLSKRYSFKIEQQGERTYCLAADDKETLTNWMNAVSLSALGIAPETITQSLQELRPAGTMRKTTSATSTMSRGAASSGGGGAKGGVTNINVKAGTIDGSFGSKGGAISNKSTIARGGMQQQVSRGGGGGQVSRVQQSNQVQASHGYADSSLFAGASANAASAQVVNVNVQLNGGATSSSNAGSMAGEETHVKQISQSMQSIDVSEAEEDEEEESSEEEEDSDEESSMASSGMEQVDFAQKRKAQQHQSAVKTKMQTQQPAPVAPMPILPAASSGGFFGNLMENINIQENVSVNKSETRNVNITENVNVNVNKSAPNVAPKTDAGLKSFFGSGQHITGGVEVSQQQQQQQSASADLLAKPIAIKPPAYNTLSHPGPISDVTTGTGVAPKVSGRAGEIYDNLTEWQSRTLQKPNNTKSRGRFASAGDPLAEERRPFDRTRTKSAERDLDEPGAFQRTQSMRSLKMWYEHQRTTGRSRGGTPEPDRISPYAGGKPQQPLIMDLDKNDRLYINPSTATLVRSKSRQGHQTLTKSSGALVPVKQAPRPATAMGSSYAVVSRDQVMMQKNYQLQMFLRQQYLAQQQQQQQQQNALLMQQQMQNQQAMFLQQQIQREEEMLRKKKEKEKKEKEKRLKQQKREQEIEEQLKRSTTIINESVVVNQGDPKVKRVFVRRAKKEPKPQTPPPPVLVAEKKEFSCQTITDTGIQTEKPESPPPTFSQTLIVQSQTPSPAPIRFVETVTVSPPTPEPEDSDAESEEEWEVLVSSDQNSWNIVAKETLPARVIRAASLSNLEFFIKDELSDETQKVLEEAEEVRFSEEVIQTILTKTVEDTTTTNTSKTISMVSESQSSASGEFAIQDVEEGEIVLPAITTGPYAVQTQQDAGGVDAANARTTTVTKISTEPFQDTQIATQETEDGQGKLLTTSFHQGHATIVDDRVAYDYGTSDEAMAEFQRHLQQMKAEFGEAGDVVSDSGMSYQTPAGGTVSVEQRVSTAKSGVQVTLGDGSQQMLQQQQLTQQQQGGGQAPAISITDMETNQVLLQPQEESFTNAYSEPQLQVTTGELGGVDVSLGDYRIAAIKRRVSTVPDLPQTRQTPEKDVTATVVGQTKVQPKGILKKRPSSSSSDVSGSASHQFTEQFLETVQQVSEGQQFAGLQPSPRGASFTKTLEVTTTIDSTLPEPVRKTTRSVSEVDADATLPGLSPLPSPQGATKSSTIVVQTNSPVPQRKNDVSKESSTVDISLESPSTKHFSTHLHKTISSSSPTLMVQVDPSAAQKPTTLLTTTLDFDNNNLGEGDSVFQAGSDGMTSATLSQQQNAISTNQSHISADQNQSSQSFASQAVQGSSGSVTITTDLSSSTSSQLGNQETTETDEELAEIMNQLKQTKLRSASISGSKSDMSLVGAVLPPLEQDIERVREKFVSTVSQRQNATENAGAIGRKLIALKRETEAKETTLNYFSRRLKEEEDVLQVIQQTEAGAGDVPYIQGRRKTQEGNVTQLREKVAGLQQSIQEGKTKIEGLEVEWKKVRPEGEVDLLSSLSRSSSSSRAELAGSASTENLAGGGGAGVSVSGGSVSVGDGGGAINGAGGGMSVSGGGSSGAIHVSGATTSMRVDPLESKAVAVEKEAMRSVLSTISSQFTARNQDFDRLRREEEEIKALLASRMRGIDLEIDQIEAEQQRMEIQQVLGDLETEDGLAIGGGGGGSAQQVEST